MDRSSPCANYVAMRAANRFRDQNSRYPGSLPSDVDQSKDVLAVEGLANSILTSSAESVEACPQPLKDACAEM